MFLDKNVRFSSKTFLSSDKITVCSTVKLININLESEVDKVNVSPADFISFIVVWFSDTKNENANFNNLFYFILITKYNIQKLFVKKLGQLKECKSLKISLP